MSAPRTYGATSARSDAVRDTVRLVGLTWSHPRGYAPLDALARVAAEEGPLAVPGPKLEWQRQSLADFESHPIVELARRYDLIVLDHPGLGAAITADALLPLDEIASHEELLQWRHESVGEAFDAYRLHEHQWAIPIDAATQVGAYRPGVIAEPASTWSEVLQLIGKVRTCLPTKSPHMLLSLLGIAAAIQPGFTPAEDQFIPRATGLAAYALLREVISVIPPHLRDLDPIGILDEMRCGEADYCPLLFGYVTYSNPAHPGRLVMFCDAPSCTALGPPGSVLGGTGLAISRHCRWPGAALAHVRQISGVLAQTAIVPSSGGQPAARAAWESEAVNRDWADFYRRTLRSQLSAWRRPRHAGWISFQHRGSITLSEAISEGRAPSRALDELDALYKASRTTPNGLICG